MNSGEFENIRNYLLKYLTSLYKQYVEQDAHQKPQRDAGPSMKTALSSALALSDEDSSVPDHVDTPVSGQKPKIPTDVHQYTWTETVSRGLSARSSGRGERSRTNRINEDDLISDLASSRTEVEELQAQVAQLHAGKQRTDALIADTAVRDQVAKALQLQMAMIAEERF